MVISVRSGDDWTKSCSLCLPGASRVKVAMAMNVAQRRPATDMPIRRRRPGRLRLRFNRRSDRIRKAVSGRLLARRRPRTRRSVDERRTWLPSRPLVQIIKAGSVVGGLLLLALIGGSIYAVVSRRPSGFLAYADRV